MSREAHFGPEATDELVAAALWYDQRRAGLGGEFTDAVLAAVRSLDPFPNAGTPAPGFVGALLARQIRVQRFPYLVVYVVTDEFVRVVAVAHDRRLPGYWATRLG